MVAECLMNGTKVWWDWCKGSLGVAWYATFRIGWPMKARRSWRIFYWSSYYYFLLHNRVASTIDSPFTTGCWLDLALANREILGSRHGNISRQKVGVPTSTSVWTLKMGFSKTDRHWRGGASWDICGLLQLVSTKSLAVVVFIWK